MGRHRSALAIVLALLTTFPAATLGSARDVPALPADALVHVDGNGDAGVECPGRARLALPASPVLSRAAFTVVALEGATGAVRVGGVEVATADPAVPLYVVLRGDEARTVALECVAGGVVDVRFLDAPIVEIVELPARVVSLTFTRFGLRTLGMDNALDLYVGVPTQGNVTVLAQAEGSPLPSFLQALGEDANATRTGLATLGSRLLADPPTKNEVARALSRIALVCGAIEEGFTFDGSTLCTIDALASVLTRYGIPVAAATRLLDRLASDPSCGPFATTAEALATVDGVVLGELTPPLACAWGWADETAERELALPPGAIVNATARELGLDGFGTDGPCGDPGLRALPAWSPQVAPFATLYGNRTLASRQLECAELLVASLRPLRYSWGTSRLVTRMGSAWYGETALTLAAGEPGEARLTLASQGPTLLDVTIDHEMLPASVGDALAPLRPSLAALGAPDDAEAAAALDALLAPVVEPSFAWLPSAAETRATLLATPTGPDTALHAARAAEAGANATFPAAWAAVPARSCGIDLVRPWLAPRCLAPLPPATLAPAVPLEAWRGSAPAAAWVAFDPAAPTTMIGAFLSAPGAPLAPADALALVFEHPAQGILRNGASTIFPVFHPTSLHVETKPASAPRAPAVDPDVTALAEFADSRYRDLVRELEARSLARSEPPQPTRAVLVGETAWMRLLDGELTEQRRVAGTVRVIDLEQGFAVQAGFDGFSLAADADLDGLPNALEAEYAAWAKPFDGTAWANVTWLALDPTNPDSDGDGMSDGWEYAHCERPALFDCGEGLAPWWPDAEGDADGDFLANGDEHALSAAALAPCIAERGAQCLREALDARRVKACATPVALAAWSEDDGDPFAIDGDCDGMWDGYERIIQFDATADDSLPATEDPDGDGATTRAEFEHLARVVEEHRDDGLAFPAAARAAAAGHFVDPRAFDTEGDGLPDSYEMIRGLHPRENGTWSLPRLLEPLQDDAHGNPDGDRYPNLPVGDPLETVEELVWTLARIARDEPRLSFPDVVAAAGTRGLDPFHPDTDRDGKDDAFEVAEENLPEVRADCSDPIVPSFDCDADGITDVNELAVAGVPGFSIASWQCLLPPSSLATPARLSWTREDSDDDGIPDGNECWLGLDPTNPADAALDPDADGLTSLAEHKATLALHPDHAEDAAWFAPGAPGHAQSLVPRALGAFAARAADRDADGIADAFELALGLEVLRADANEDLDRDNLTNADELRWTRRGSLAPSAIGATLVANGAKDRALLEALRALAPSPADPDSDDDGAADGWEARADFDMHPADPTDATLDADGDGATAAEEFAAYAARFAAHVALAGTGWFRAHPDALLSPRIADRDRDRLLDGYELTHAARQGCAATTLYANGTGPWAKCFDAWTRGDAEDDFDGDGLTNVEEHEGWSVTILVAKVAVSGVEQERVAREGRTRPDPLAADTSGGGVIDREKAPHAREGCPDAGSSLDTASFDTDADGLTDYVERWQWTAVMGLPEDIDGDCFVNAADTDSDGDSFVAGDVAAFDLSDGEEIRLRVTDPTRRDTDEDGVEDGREIFLWQASGRDALNEDADGDGLAPARDPDSDGDGIPDGYEFGTGLEPWRASAAGADADGDGLFDLCEYQLHAGLAAPSCGFDYPLVSGGSVDAHSGAIDWCLHPREVDCDGDGIGETFEAQHRGLGCDPFDWQDHGTPGAFSPCAQAYLDSFNRGHDSVFEESRALQLSGRELRIVSVELRYAAELDSSSLTCFYHRHCRASLRVGGADPLVADVVVSDPLCSLRGVALIVSGTYLAKGSGLVPLPKPIDQMNLDDLRSVEGANAKWASVPASAIASSGCAPGVAGASHFLRVRIPSLDALRSDPGALLWRAALDVVAWDDTRLTMWGLHERSALAADTLAALNAHLADSYHLANRQFGERLITDSATLWRDVTRALEPFRVTDPALLRARELLASGFEAAEDELAWFEDQYEQRRVECGLVEWYPRRPPAYAELPEDCAIREHVQDLIGARLRLIIAKEVIADYLDPAASTLARGERLLRDAGLGPRTIAQHVAEAYGQAPGPDPLLLFDAFAQPKPQGCDGALASFATLAGTLALEPASARLARAAEAIVSLVGTYPGSRPSAGASCYVDVLVAGGPAPLADAALLEVVGLTDPATTTLDVNDAVLAMDSFERALGRASLTLAVVASAISFVFGDDPLVFPALVGLCAASVVLGIAGVATAITGVGYLVAIGSYLLAGMCVVELVAKDPTRPFHVPAIAPSLGHALGLGYAWSYRVDAHPETEARGSGAAPLLRVVITPRFSGPDVRSVCGSPSFSYTPLSLAFEVLIEQARGTAYVRDSHARVTLDARTGTIAAEPRLAADGSYWRIEKEGASIRLDYHGPHVPGSRKVTVAALPQLVARTVPPSGVAVRVPADAAYEPLRAIGFPSYRPLTGLPFDARAPSPHACPGVPVRTEVTLWRGVAAARPPASITDVDVLATRVAPSKWELRAPGAPRAPPGVEYGYYWDLGDVGLAARASYSADPSAPVPVAFDGVPPTVRLSVVDVTNHRLVATGSERLRAPTVASLTASRVGSTVTLVAKVSDDYQCVRVGILQDGHPLVPKGACEAQTVLHAAAGIGASSNFTLDLEGALLDGPPPSVEVLGRQSAESILGTKNAVSKFSRGVPSTDVYVVDIPNDYVQFSKVLYFVGQPGFTVEAHHADGRPPRIIALQGDVNSGRAYLGAYDERVDGRWTIYVRSNGEQGSYDLGLNLGTFRAPFERCDGYAAPSFRRLCLHGGKMVDQLPPPYTRPLSTKTTSAATSEKLVVEAKTRSRRTLVLEYLDVAEIKPGRALPRTVRNADEATMFDASEFVRVSCFGNGLRGPEQAEVGLFPLAPSLSWTWRSMEVSCPAHLAQDDLLQVRFEFESQDRGWSIADPIVRTGEP